MKNKTLDIKVGEVVELYRVSYAMRVDGTANIIRVLGPRQYKVTNKVITSVDMGDTIRGNVRYDRQKAVNMEPIESAVRDSRIIIATKETIDDAIEIARSEMEKWSKREMQAIENKKEKLLEIQAGIKSGMVVKYGHKDLK